MTHTFMRRALRGGLALVTLGAGAGGAFAQTSSPFAPPDQDMGKYVTNSGQGLDTGCSYRSDGPLIVRFAVPAPVNKTKLNADGTLADPGAAVAAKLVGQQAKISFPVYDIDDKAITDGTYAPEIDRVSWNGEFIKTLAGFNNTWVNDSFTVDISKVKFYVPGETTTYNEFRVDIDQGNIGNGEYWCMAVDWVGIEFDAAYPFLLAHGISAGRDTWLEQDAHGVLTTLDDVGVIHERFSTPDPNGSVAANAAWLKAQVQGYLDRYKAKKVNVIAHSKGGLDTQTLAVLAPPDFEVLSLGTLSTPHRGSVVADLTLLQRAWADIYVNNGSDPQGFAQQFVTLSLAGFSGNWPLNLGPQPPGIYDLKTEAFVAAMSAGVRNSVANTFTIGADAGPNCGRAPTNAEIDPMNPAAGYLYIGNYTYDALRLAYQSICTYESAREVSFQVLPTFAPDAPPITVLTYSAVLGAANPNDIVVGLRSANPGYGTPLGDNASTNHATVKNSGNVRRILDKTIPLR